MLALIFFAVIGLVLLTIACVLISSVPWFSLTDDFII